MGDSISKSVTGSNETAGGADVSAPVGGEGVCSWETLTAGREPKMRRASLSFLVLEEVKSAIESLKGVSIGETQPATQVGEWDQGRSYKVTQISQ